MTDDKVRMALIRRIVREQVFDEGLWCKPRYIEEAYLQEALLFLHKAVRDVDITPLKERHWND